MNRKPCTSIHQWATRMKNHLCSIPRCHRQQLLWSHHRINWCLNPRKWFFHVIIYKISSQEHWQLMSCKNFGITRNSATHIQLLQGLEFLLQCQVDRNRYKISKSIQALKFFCQRCYASKNDPQTIVWGQTNESQSWTLSNRSIWILAISEQQTEPYSNTEEPTRPLYNFIVQQKCTTVFVDTFFEHI
jgi:hypothetical protein